MSVMHFANALVWEIIGPAMAGPTGPCATPMQDNGNECCYLYDLYPSVLCVVMIRGINSKGEQGNDNIITSTQQPRRRRGNSEQLNIRRP